MDKKAEAPNRERLAETELLKLTNAVLDVENKLLKLQAAERNRDLLILNILRAHGFKDDANIRLFDGMIEGEKLNQEEDSGDSTKAI